MIVIARSLRRRRTDILYVGESSLDVGEQTVGETTRRRNDRLPFEQPGPEVRAELLLFVFDPNLHLFLNPPFQWSLH